MPSVSGIDDAYCISVHLMFLSDCVVQVMRVWSLAAVLSLLAKNDTPRRGNAGWFRADPCGLNVAVPVTRREDRNPRCRSPLEA